MKFLLSVLIAFLLCIGLNAQDKKSTTSIKDTLKPTIIVSTACGQCQFKMEGKGCDLAVKVNGKAYFVEGTSIDEHGDAHANDGFCNAIRKAEVQGEVVNDKFKVSYFKLIKTQSTNKH